MVQFTQQFEVVPLREISTQFRGQLRYIDGLRGYFGHVPSREVRGSDPVESRFHVYAERLFSICSGNGLCRWVVFRFFCQRIDTLLQCLYLGIQGFDTRFGDMVYGGVEKLLRYTAVVGKGKLRFTQHLGDELSHFDFRKEIFFHRKNIMVRISKHG